MNKVIGIILIVSALIINAILGYFLYGSDESEDDSQFLANMANIHELQQIDAAWSLATLQTLSVPDSDFDRVVAFLPRFRELRNQISNSELAGSQAPAPLRNKLLGFLSLLEGKEQAIEHFKSNFAVVRNSLKYLPLAARTLSVKASEMDDAGLAKRIQDLEQRTDSYLKALDESSKNLLLNSLDEMEQHLMEFPSDIANPLGNFVSHARVLIERKVPMDENVARVTNDQVSKSGSELISLYKDYEESLAQARDQRNAQRNLYILIGALLLVLIALIAGIHTFLSASRFNRRLEEEVRKRTRELERKAYAATESVVGEHQGKSMGTMDAMVATLAHEINTPLGYMGSNLEVLQSGTEKLNLLMEEFDNLDSVSKDSDAEQIRSRMSALTNAVTTTREQAMLDEFPVIISDMGEGIIQIQHVIQELRDFSRKDRLEEEWFDLNQCVENALKMSQHQIGKDVKITKKLGDLPQIYGSQADMNQVIINLLSNAVHAITEAGRPHGLIKITTGVIKDAIVVDILDSGIGMEKDIVEKIFDPFFTTRDVGKGTGLGLSIVQKIIRQHKGSVSVKSEAGKGTKFRIALPSKSKAG